MAASNTSRLESLLAGSSRRQAVMYTSDISSSSAASQRLAGELHRVSLQKAAMDATSSNSAAALPPSQRSRKRGRAGAPGFSEWDENTAAVGGKAGGTGGTSTRVNRRRNIAWSAAPRAAGAVTWGVPQGCLVLLRNTALAQQCNAVVVGVVDPFSGILLDMAALPKTTPGIEEDFVREARDRARAAASSLGVHVASVTDDVPLVDGGTTAPGTSPTGGWPGAPALWSALSDAVAGAGSGGGPFAWAHRDRLRGFCGAWNASTGTLPALAAALQSSPCAASWARAVQGQGLPAPLTPEALWSAVVVQGGRAAAAVGVLSTSPDPALVAALSARIGAPSPCGFEVPADLSAPPRVSAFMDLCRSEPAAPLRVPLQCVEGVQSAPCTPLASGAGEEEDSVLQ